jgi:prolyl-tRNA synthetase
LIKTLVYKPKTAKTAAPTPVVVIAREQTETNSGAIGKKLNLKDLRVASEDLLTQFFSLDKNSCTWKTLFQCSNDQRVDTVSPLSITESTFSRVVTVLDSTIASSSSLFAVHANSSSETIFLSGKDIVAYLKNLETDEIKVQELDFASLATGTAAQSSKSPVKEKEDAKIEGAVQIAIGVKKEVDFSSWYTNVRLHLPDLKRSLNPVFRCYSRPT